MKNVLSNRITHCAIAVGLAIVTALPIIASEMTDTGQADKNIQAELKAWDEAKPQTKCPTSGKPVNDDIRFTYMGHVIKTCCNDCLAGAKKNPIGAILGIRKNGETPVLAKGMKYQTSCPMSGKPIDGKAYKVKGNLLVNLCCEKCVAAVEKNPEKVIKTMLEKRQAPRIIAMEQKICPVSGGKVNDSNTVTVAGKKVKTCCAACKGAIEADPKKIFLGMADRGEVPASAK